MILLLLHGSLSLCIRIRVIRIIAYQIIQLLMSMFQVYDAWTYDTTPNVQPRGKKSGKTGHPEGTIVPDTLQFVICKCLFIAEAEAMATGEGSNVGSNTAPPTPVSQEKEPEKVTIATDAPPSDKPVTSPVPAEITLPEHVPYVLIGAGTASFACMKAIRERDPNAKVCCGV